MNGLAAKIGRWIEAQGPIPVAEYMRFCQFDADAGSYTARRTIGRDFITAPEISQTFGEMLGLWVAQTWLDQGGPAHPRLVELGPGRGTLMADAIRAIKAAAPAFLDGAEIALVEASPALTTTQRATLKAVDASIVWHGRIDACLAGRPLFVIANEFFDCLPIHQYVKTERGWCERMVVIHEDRLGFALAPDPVPLGAVEAPQGAVRESAPAATALAEEIAHAVTAEGGGALIIDYGYETQGFGETLQAVADGKFVDVLAAPGESDLSAHVDFSALAHAGASGGAAVFGSVPQGQFLRELGIGGRAERLIRSNPDSAGAIAAAIDRLVNPAAMGALFKVIAMVPPAAPKPAGFG